MACYLFYFFYISIHTRMYVCVYVLLCAFAIVIAIAGVGLFFSVDF